MNKELLKSLLEKEGLGEIDEINYKKEFYIVDSFYEFDKVEVDAAIMYANDGCGEDRDDEWFEEFYSTYLFDIAADNLEEVIDEICEKHKLFADITLCEIERKAMNKVEVIVVFSEKEFDIEKVIDEIEQ
ncbi:MAG: hypothetical protein RR840_09770 [Clostridium sp.]